MIKPARYNIEALKVSLSDKTLYGMFPWELQWIIWKLRNFLGDIVELGTFRGSTARELALAFPDRKIFCVDNIDPAYGLTKEEVCAEAKDFSNVELILTDSKNFTIPDTTAAIIIDADHTWDGVRGDTEKAISYMRGRSPGVIIWHDYDQEHQVFPYLNWMIKNGVSDIFHVQATTLAFRDF